jgi:hypothetical protein
MTKNVNPETALAEAKTDPIKKDFSNLFAYQIRCRLHSTKKSTSLID